MPRSLWETAQCLAAGTVGDGISDVLVFDSEGRLIDDSGAPPGSKQAWLDSLSGSRWPCLAGQTILMSVLL